MRAANVVARAFGSSIFSTGHKPPSSLSSTNVTGPRITLLLAKMKKKIRVSVLLLLLCSLATNLWARDSGGKWDSISIGNYQGYAELYTRHKVGFVISGGIGIEASLEVTEKGVIWNGSFYPWDAPGRQASRYEKNQKEYKRIFIQGKCGPVTVVDVMTERPKGSVIKLIRMVMTPVPNNQ